VPKRKGAKYLIERRVPLGLVKKERKKKESLRKVKKMVTISGQNVRGGSYKRIIHRQVGRIKTSKERIQNGEG